jgi:hypothetical protein
MLLERNRSNLISGQRRREMNALEQHRAVDPHTVMLGGTKIDVEVRYDKAKKAWLIPSPILLQDDGDTVYWNLTEVFTFGWGAPIDHVEIDFTGGPSGFKANGPHTTVPYRDTKATIPDNLYGDHRNKLYGLYCYDLLVFFKDGSGMQRVRLNTFPIDPQIDNVAPPGTIYPDQGHDECGEEP